MQQATSCRNVAQLMQKLFQSIKRTRETTERDYKQQKVGHKGDKKNNKQAADKLFLSQ